MMACAKTTQAKPINRDNTVAAEVAATNIAVDRNPTDVATKIIANSILRNPIARTQKFRNEFRNEFENEADQVPQLNFSS